MREDNHEPSSGRSEVHGASGVPIICCTVDGLGCMMTGKVWAPSEEADREEA